MNQMSSDKFNVAWFKLAEFVIRKEKERALYIFRLLVHSLNDAALIAQLEGDLLLSFNDEKAVDCYIKAAHLYEKSNRIMQAAAIYEHLGALTNQFDIPKLIAFYEQLGNETKVIQYQSQLTQAPPP